MRISREDECWLALEAAAKHDIFGVLYVTLQHVNAIDRHNVGHNVGAPAQDGICHWYVLASKVVQNRATAAQASTSVSCNRTTP